PAERSEISFMELNSPLYITFGLPTTIFFAASRNAFSSPVETIGFALLPLQLRFFHLFGLLEVALVCSLGNVLLPFQRGLPRASGEGKTDDATLHSAVQLRQLAIHKRHVNSCVIRQAPLIIGGSKSRGRRGLDEKSTVALRAGLA